MLVIRLQRTGRANDPTYRVVLAEKRAAAKGKFLEVLGHYLPARKPAVLELKKDRAEHWIALGACPSETIARLLKAQGVKNVDKFISKYTKRRSKKEPPPEAAPAPAAAPAAEKPAEEKPAEAPAPVAEEKPVEAPAPAAEEPKA
jgi:small subunit ribosomal protein S16